MSGLTKLKCMLYSLLLNKNTNELTDVEVDQMAALANDKDIQKVLEQRRKK